MLKSPQRFLLPPDNKHGGKQFHVDVNWEDNVKTNECKVLRFTFPDGTHAFVERQHLMEMMFAIGSYEEQKDLVPQKLTRSRWYETTVGVKATKDIRKGEMINFPIKLSLPDQTDEILGPVWKR